MRPEFGSRIHEHVFGPANASTAGQLAYEVRASLERWEPRIELEGVTVSADPGDETVLYIDVRYSISSSNDPRNLVFPFYVIGEHEPVAEITAGELPALEGGS
jgi:phage baseplate assembly protein W